LILPIFFYQGKLIFKLHVYKEYVNTQDIHMEDEDIMTRDYGDSGYLT